jgi:hypothetical protein
LLYGNQQPDLLVLRRQKNLNNPHNIEGEEQGWRTDYCPTSSCSNQDSVLSAKEWINNVIEQNGEPRSRPK